MITRSAPTSRNESPRDASFNFGSLPGKCCKAWRLIVRASGYIRAANDWYVEPRHCVDSLLDVEPFSGVVWDPSCGGGNIPMALQARGIAAIGSDLVPRGFTSEPCDFFEQTKRVDSIVTNPPYGVIERYIRHALSLTTDKVCILARLALLEGQARQALFRETPLARVWVSSRRLSMPPGGSDTKAIGGTIAYAWFVWSHKYIGTAPTVGWLS